MCLWTDADKMRDNILLLIEQPRNGQMSMGAGQTCWDVH